MKAWEADPETGMPVHLPMRLNADGQGPIDDDEPGMWGCWCPDGVRCERVWAENERP